MAPALRGRGIRVHVVVRLQRNVPHVRRDALQPRLHLRARGLESPVRTALHSRQLLLTWRESTTYTPCQSSQAPLGSASPRGPAPQHVRAAGPWRTVATLSRGHGRRDMPRRAWTWDALSARGMAPLSTRGLSATVQTTRHGYFEVHHTGELTAAWCTGETWTFWRVWPSHQRAVLTELPPRRAVPRVSADRDALRIIPSRDSVPEAAWHALRWTVRWLRRQHADTPLIRAQDVDGSAEAIADIDGITSCRICVTTYSALPTEIPAQELAVYAWHGRDSAHELVRVRVDRARHRVQVATLLGAPSQHHMTSRSISWRAAEREANAHGAGGSALERWALRRALRRSALPPLLDGSRREPRAPTVFSEHRAELLRRERWWYERRHWTWPLYRHRDDEHVGRQRSSPDHRGRGPRTARISGPP